MIVRYNKPDNIDQISGHHNLISGEEYIALGAYFRPCSGHYFNEVSVQSGQDRTPAIFNLKYFDIVDKRVPENWILEYFSEYNAYTLDPQEFAGDFWDRYHDGDAEAEKVFERVMRKLHKFHGWDFEPEVFDDFIEQLLQDDNHYLRAWYDPYVKTYLPRLSDYVDVDIKIRALGSTLCDTIRDNSLYLQTLIDSLEAIETYAVQLEDKKKKQIVDQYFFKPILEQLLLISLEDDNYRYRRLFKDHLGPACEEACDQINANWRQEI